MHHRIQEILDGVADKCTGLIIKEFHCATVPKNLFQTEIKKLSELFILLMSVLDRAILLCPDCACI